MIGRALGAAASVGETVMGRLPSAQLSQARVLDQTASRPWPVPDRPWLMAQTWLDLLFAHWALEPEAIARILPAALSLDTFDGHAWIGVTPFEVAGLRPRGGLPAPRVSRFPEINVRTYASVAGKPGIFFLSLDAASLTAVLAARRTYRLPYFRARMSIHRQAGRIHYDSDRISSDGDPAAFAAEYEPTGDVFQAEPGSLEYFLAERYCLYTTDESGAPLRGDIQHPPWPLQPAAGTITRNTMTRPWEIQLPDEPPLLHYSRAQRVLIWSLRPAA